METPVRIAKVLGTLTGYGVENGVMKSYRAMDRDKIQFDFFIHGNSTRVPYEKIEKLGGRVYVIPPYWHLKQYLTTLIRLFQENRYQIVHAHISTMSVFALYAAKKAGVPIRIIQNHSTAARGEKKSMLKYALRPCAKLFATHYAAVSERAGAWLFGKRTMKRGQVTIFNPVIPIEKFVYNEALRTRVRDERNLHGKFVVGHVGRFCYQKNQPFLLDIFQAIHRRKPNALLMMIGDGETMSAMKEKAEKMGLRDSVLMLGHQDDVFPLYQAMDVFILPSRYEGLPGVTIEAQLAGLRVLTSTRVTPEAKVRDDMTYLPLSAGAERWAEEALRVNPENRACYGDFSSFDVDVQAKRMEQYYLELLGSLKARNITKADDAAL